MWSYYDSKSDKQVKDVNLSTQWVLKLYLYRMFSALAETAVWVDEDSDPHQRSGDWKCNVDQSVKHNSSSDTLTLYLYYNNNFVQIVNSMFDKSGSQRQNTIHATC